MPASMFIYHLSQHLLIACLNLHISTVSTFPNCLPQCSYITCLNIYSMLASMFIYHHLSQLLFIACLNVSLPLNFYILLALIFIYLYLSQLLHISVSTFIHLTLYNHCNNIVYILCHAANILNIL